MTYDRSKVSDHVGGIGTDWEEGVIKGENVNALDTQVGGGHYKDLKIQPIEFIHANDLPFIEGSIVKYISRWREKGGVQDLEKIKHYVDLLIDLEGDEDERNPVNPSS